MGRRLSASPWLLDTLAVFGAEADHGREAPCAGDPEILGKMWEMPLSAPQPRATMAAIRCCPTDMGGRSMMYDGRVDVVETWIVFAALVSVLAFGVFFL